MGAVVADTVMQWQRPGVLLNVLQRTGQVPTPESPSPALGGEALVYNTLQSLGKDEGNAGSRHLEEGRNTTPNCGVCEAFVTEVAFGLSL